MRDKFDDELRSTFENLEDGINPELIWDGIHAKVKDAKKKKRRFFIWWFFGLGICGVVIIALLNTKSTARLYNEETISEEMLVQTSSSPYAEVDDPISSTINAQEKAEPEFNSLVPERTIESNFESDSREVDRQLAKYQAKKYREEKTKVFHNATQGPTGEAIDNWQSVKPKGTITQSNVGEPSATFSDFDVLSASNEGVSVKLDDSFRNDLMYIPYLKVFKVSPMRFSRLLEKPLIVPLARTKTLSLSQSKASSTYNTVEFYGGVSVGNKTIVSSNSTYDIARNESERLLEQLNLGVRSRVAKYMDFELYVGLRYSRINDVWKKDFEYTKDLPYTYVEYQTEISDGVIEDQFRTDTLAHIHKRYIEQYNTEQLLTVPFEIRYSREVNNWAFSVGMGIDMSYLFASNHQILGLDGLPTEESKEGQWLRPMISTGIYTSYSLNSVWSLSGNLNYRRVSLQNNAILSDLKSNYKLFGVELGIVRNL